MYEVWIDATSRPALMPDARRKKMGSLGPAGIGIVIKKDNKIIHEVNRYIGIYDNNAAEYMGFIEAMLLLIDMNVGEAIVYTDSMLLQRQMKGEVNCTSEKLIDLYAEAMRISQFIPSLIIKWIPRGENTQADKLADAVFKDWDKIIK